MNELINCKLLLLLFLFNNEIIVITNIIIFDNNNNIIKNVTFDNRKCLQWLASPSLHTA